MSTTAIERRTVAARPGLAGILMRLVTAWLRRSRTRPRLWTLSDHELRDLGLERCAADRESLKPFWRG
ncbi:DUF1127 domain-containing protein [Inquilinus limosus]|uniref:YjiS-like domain-containing protein n=1 Tax=Inquilinus limosus MP06 TaxID=1398085 RepID=A0A0A0D6Z1_9PROT|nr:DUF1127 domain-containing protein [Inquilinus limosus]KGM33854.1 hypothetical protein P409_13485 [Inquilinus limosus MP06]